MKRLLITIASVATLFSCSWMSDFFIVNKSDQPIEIIYRFKQYEHRDTHAATCIFEYSNEVPKICEIETFWSGPSDDCRVLRQDEYKYDKENCEIKLILPPYHSIKVWDTSNFTGSMKERFDEFELGSLTLRTAGGLIQYQAIELFKAFKRESSDTDYFLYYQ